MCGIWQLFLDCECNDSSNVLWFKKLFENVKFRGPDQSNYIVEKNTIIGFHRLAINGLTSDGMQPFRYEDENYKYTLICNGEIYNHFELEQLCNYKSKSNSDCETLLPFFVHCNKNINQFLNMINGEFALVLSMTNKLTNTVDIYLGTDPYSVRPMFYQELEGVDGLLISSLQSGLVRGIKRKRLLGGEYIHYKQEKNVVMFIEKCFYHSEYIEKIKPLYSHLVESYELYQMIVNAFTKAVERRLMSDRPYCCLLSGGLDSSLVAAVAQRLIKEKKLATNLHTFTIGMDGGSDLEYANQVAEFIKSTHQEINFTPEDGLDAIDNVIKTCETYDITTIRASVGQNLIAKYISENTDFKVVLNGDGADEVEMGYIYFYLAPNFDEASKEAEKLVRNIHFYDGLRVDRNISYYGLEARVPFLDKEFVELYLSIDPELKIPTKSRMEKYLIRKAFATIYAEDPILPDEVLWRKKEAFSDGVSQKEKSWYVMTQEYGKSKITDLELEYLQQSYADHNQPTSHESAYYRKKFCEYFGKEACDTIPYFWLPNWTNNKDPSARTLNVYHEHE